MPSRSGAAHGAGSSDDGHRSDADLSVLEAEARYHRDRLALYRARVLSAKPTSSGRLQELERAAASAAARLRHAASR